MSVTIVGTGFFFGLALALLGLFFATKNARFDRAAEWSFVAFGVVAVPAMVEIDGRLNAGPIGTVVLIVGILGAVGVGLGELLITLRAADFRRAATPITAAFVAFLAWIGGVSVLAVTGGGVPTGIGWLGIVSIALGIVSIALIARVPGAMRGDVEPGAPQMAGVLVAMVGVVAWLLLLGVSG